MVVGARQSFRFFRQKTWFLENNRGLPYLGIRFSLLDYYYQIIKTLVRKNQFHINHVSHLKQII